MEQKDYAVIEACGRQYRVAVGDKVHLEKLEGVGGTALEFPVLMARVGESVVTGAEAAAKKVKAEIVAHYKDKKITVYKYKAKKNVRKKQGHRHQYTVVHIKEII